MRKRQKSRRTGLGLIAIMVILVCGIVTYKRQELEHVNAKTTARVEELQKDIKMQKERTEDIEKYKAYIQTYKFVEEMAREKLGLIYKDEIILKPED